VEQRGRLVRFGLRLQAQRPAWPEFRPAMTTAEEFDFDEILAEITGFCEEIGRDVTDIELSAHRELGVAGRAARRKSSPSATRPRVAAGSRSSGATF
jgi:hypothetical protein